MKFTDRSIQSLEAKATRYIVWKDNGEGLGVRVSPKGKQSFIFMYRFKGTARMMTLGEYPGMTLADANLAHREAVKLLEKGIDPGKQIVAERKAERAAETVKELIEEYIEKWAKPRKRTWKKDDLILKKDVLRQWGSNKAKDITRGDIRRLLERILEREAPIQANRTLAIVRKMFNYALSKDIVEVNPCMGIKAPAPEQRRDRVLTEQEVRDFWHNLDKTDMHKNTRNAYKLMILTGQRIGEVLSSRWSDMDLKNGWWVIPAEKSKNKLQHRVPLSTQALAVIEDIKQYASKEDDKSGDAAEKVGAKAVEKEDAEQTTGYLFPSPRKGQHIDVTATAHALKRNREKLGTATFTPHDLRRTAASHMTGAGISRLVVSKILNHAEPHITAVYDRHSYDAEKRKALTAWGKKITAILTQKETERDDKVVHLRPA